MFRVDFSDFTDFTDFSGFLRFLVFSDFSGNSGNSGNNDTMAEGQGQGTCAPRGRTFGTSVPSVLYYPYSEILDVNLLEIAEIH